MTDDVSLQCTECSAGICGNGPRVAYGQYTFCNKTCFDAYKEKASEPVSRLIAGLAHRGRVLGWSDGEACQMSVPVFAKRAAAGSTVSLVKHRKTLSVNYEDIAIAMQEGLVKNSEVKAVNPFAQTDVELTDKGWETAPVIL